MFIFSSSNTVLAAFSAGALLVVSAQGHLFAENSVKEASLLFPLEGNRFLEGNATDGHVHGTTHGVDIFEECFCEADTVSCLHQEDEYMCYCHSDGETALCNIYGVEIFEECSCDGETVSCLHAEDSSMCVCDGGDTPTCDASALGDGGHDEAHGHTHGTTHGVDIFEECVCDGDSVSCSHAEDEYMCYCHSDGVTALCNIYGVEIFEECTCDGDIVSCLHAEDSSMCTCDGDVPTCDASALGDGGHDEAHGHEHVHGHTHGVDIFEDCRCDGDSVSCSHTEDEYMCYCHSDGETAICLEYGYEIFEECSCDGETVNCLHTEDAAMCTCEGDAPVCDSSALGDHGHSHAMSEDSSASMIGASLIVNLMTLVGVFLVGGQ